MYTSHWKVFTNTTTLNAARKVLGRLRDCLDRGLRDLRFAEYAKGGHVAEFEIDHAIEDWPLACFESIAVAQRVGRGWQLDGRVEEELDLSSNQTAIAGVTKITCHISSTHPKHE